MRSYEDADLLVRLAKETGGSSSLRHQNSPSYLLALIQGTGAGGCGENTRYQLEDTAMNWVRLVKNAAGNKQIADILSRPDDAIIWQEHCRSYARRLFERDAGAFKLFMDELRSVDPAFVYP